MRVALLAAAVALGGCGLFYRPVPIRSAIGKERTALAGDSFNVHHDPRFDVYGPGSRAVYDGYEQLNRTFRAFDRYFASAVPRLSVIMYPESSKPYNAAPDDDLRARGATVMRFVRPFRVSERERVGDDGYGGTLWPVGPGAARLLLTTIATAPGTVDTTVLTRFPAWYRSAVMSVVGDGTTSPVDVEYMKENRSSRWALAQFLALERPTSADSVLFPYLRDDADDADRRFASQSSAFMQFLLEREGPGILASLGRGFANGESFAVQAAQFKTLPATMSDLDERWLAWLAAQRPIY